MLVPVDSEFRYAFADCDCLETSLTSLPQPRTFELFQLLGIFDDVQKVATPTPTMRSYKLPGGTQPLKIWNLLEQDDVRPDLPYVSYITILHSVS